MSHGYWWATRKRDGARCIVWIYNDAGGVQRVSCCRTHEATLADFHLIVPVASPFWSSADDLTEQFGA